MADMRIEDMHLIEQTVEGGGWQLFARDASFYDRKQVVLLHHVRAQLQSDALQTIYIEAHSGQFNGATGNMSVQGGVQLQYLQEYTIETDVLYWQASSRVLQTDTAVKIVSAFVQIAGIGLDGNADQQNFVLRDAVHASFRLQ